MKFWALEDQYVTEIWKPHYLDTYKKSIEKFNWIFLRIWIKQLAIP